MANQSSSERFPESSLTLDDKQVSIYRVSKSNIFQIIADQVLKVGGSPKYVNMKRPNTEGNRPIAQLLNRSAVNKSHEARAKVAVHTLLRTIFDVVPSLDYPMQIEADSFIVEKDVRTGFTYVNLLPNQTATKDLETEKRSIHNLVSSIVGLNQHAQFHGLIDITTGVVLPGAPSNVEDHVAEVVHENMPIQFTLEPASYIPRNYWNE